MYNIDPNLFEGLILGFIRTGTALMLMPVFGYANVPAQAKIGLALVVALILAPAASVHLAPGPPGVISLAAAVISEIIVGLIFGLISILILMSAQLAGTVLGVQIGFGVARVVDPSIGGSVSLLGKIYYSLALIIFIILDIHHKFLEALSYTFTIIPLGGAIFPSSISMSYTRLTAEIFVVGVKLAAPVMAIILTIQVGLGFMARVMPRMNVFLFGLNIKILVGMIGIAVTMPLFVYIINGSFDIFIKGLIEIINLLAGQ